MIKNERSIYVTLVLVVCVFFMGCFNVSNSKASSYYTVDIDPVPIGSIWMWAQSANPPAGWYVCNSSNNGIDGRIPVLSGRFILCYKPGTYALNATGGASSTTLAIGDLPAHDHSAPSTIITSVTFRTRGYVVSAGAVSVITGGSSISNTILNRAQGSGTAVTRMPPYYVLKYIIYLGV